MDWKRFDTTIKKALKTESDKQGVSASGESVRSLRSEEKPSKYTLFGAKYWLWIDSGRGKDTKPRGKRGEGDKKMSKVVKSIYDWLGFRKYGLSFRNDKERLSLAFAIRAKQAEEGSFRFHNRSQRTTVVRKAIEAALPTLRGGIIDTQTETIRTDIQDAYNSNK